MEAETAGTEYDATGTSGADTDMDWEAEQRWHDKPWVFVVTLIGGGCVALTAIALVMGAQSVTVFGVGWLIMAVFFGWLMLRLRRRIAREIGVSGWQLPVVARLLQKERVPRRDPAARRALALLARRQRAQMHNYRWLWPAMAALYLLMAVLHWTAGGTGVAVFWLCVAVGSGASHFQYRRSIARADRVLSRLGGDAAPGRTA